MTRARTIALAALLLVVGCGDAGEGLLVSFQSYRTIPDEAEALEVTVSAAEDGRQLATEEYELADANRFPVALGLTQGDETPEDVVIVARLRVGPVVVAAGGTEATFVAGRTAERFVILEDL